MTARIICLAAAFSVAVAGAAQPTAAPADVDAAALKVLADLEAAGEKYTTLQADIDYRVDIRTLGDSEERTGWVAYRKEDARAKTPTKFRVTFDTLRQGGGKKIKAEVNYVFDGQWFHVAKHRIKHVTEYQLAAKGERVEPLKIGKGPFPLPFGQKAADVVKYFTAAVRKPSAADPKGTTCLRLTVRPARAREMSVRRLDMWIDRATNLPVKIRSDDKSKNITTVTFKNIRTNKDVAEGVFKLPRRIGWERVVRPLKEAGQIGM